MDVLISPLGFPCLILKVLLEHFRRFLLLDIGWSSGGG